MWCSTVNLQKTLRQRSLSPKTLLRLPISPMAQVTLSGIPQVSHPKARHCPGGCGLALVPPPAWPPPQACLGKSHSCTCTFNIPSSHGIHERTPAPGGHSPALTARIRRRYTHNQDHHEDLCSQFRPRGKERRPRTRGYLVQIWHQILV